MYELAEVYHSENIEKVSDEFINISGIKIGSYDNVKDCKYDVPTYLDIGKVYKRLIVMVNDKEEEFVDTLIDVLSSWIIEKIDNYNSSMYYENPGYIYECYIENKVIKSKTKRNINENMKIVVINIGGVFTLTHNFLKVFMVSYYIVNEEINKWKENN